MPTAMKYAIGALHNWCSENKIPCTAVCTEGDLHIYSIPRREAKRAISFLASLKESAGGIHISGVSGRSNYAISISQRAISEQSILAIVDSQDSPLSRKLDAAMFGISDHEPDVCLDTHKAFSDRLMENLNQMAADYQPMDVIKSVNQAMADMRLHDALKAAGIMNGLSHDKQTIHFYIMDDQGEKREIASYQVAVLSEPSKLEEFLDQLSDLTQKRAPGSGKQERQRVRDSEQAIRQIAKQHAIAAKQEQTTAGAPQGA